MTIDSLHVRDLTREPFEQFWGGRPVPMAGVAGVVVSPEYRRRGVASMMMLALANRAVELGDAVSSLYPATVAPYRRTGWEIVGAKTRLAIDANFLRGLGSLEVPVRSGTKGDVELVQLLHRRRVRALQVARVEPLGRLHGRRDQGVSLCAVVGRRIGLSVAKTVHAHVSPDDPIHLLLPEEASHEVRHARWMSRVLDAPKAVSMRGFPAGVAGSAPLMVEDPLLPSQDGTWLLELDGGRGSRRIPKGRWVSRYGVRRATGVPARVFLSRTPEPRGGEFPSVGVRPRRRWEMLVPWPEYSSSSSSSPWPRFWR